MALRVRNLQSIRNGSATPQMLHEALADIIGGIDQISRQSNADASGSETAPPPPINAFSVTAQDGIFHAQITDNGKIYRGVNYHLQYATDPNFTNPANIHLGPARDFRAHLGNQTLYWRAYSDYSTSSHSEPVIHGGSVPIAVTGGGTATGPIVPPGQGSGTGAVGDVSGFGPIPYRTQQGLPPKRA